MPFMTTTEMHNTETLLYAIKGYMIDVKYLSRHQEILYIITRSNASMHECHARWFVIKENRLWSTTN